MIAYRVAFLLLYISVCWAQSPPAPPANTNIIDRIRSEIAMRIKAQTLNMPGQSPPTPPLSQMSPRPLALPQPVPGFRPPTVQQFPQRGPVLPMPSYPQVQPMPQQRPNQVPMAIPRPPVVQQGQTAMRPMVPSQPGQVMIPNNALLAATQQHVAARLRNKMLVPNPLIVAQLRPKALMQAGKILTQNKDAIIRIGDYVGETTGDVYFMLCPLVLSDASMAIFQIPTEASILQCLKPQTCHKLAQLTSNICKRLPAYCGMVNQLVRMCPLLHARPIIVPQPLPLPTLPPTLPPTTAPAPTTTAAPTLSPQVVGILKTLLQKIITMFWAMSASTSTAAPSTPQVPTSGPTSTATTRASTAAVTTAAPGVPSTTIPASTASVSTSSATTASTASTANSDATSTATSSSAATSVSAATDTTASPSTSSTAASTSTAR